MNIRVKTLCVTITPSCNVPCLCFKTPQTLPKVFADLARFPNVNGKYVLQALHRYNVKDYFCIVCNQYISSFVEMVPVGFEPTTQASSELRSTIGTTGPTDLIILLHNHHRKFSLCLFHRGSDFYIHVQSNSCIVLWHSYYTHLRFDTSFASFTSNYFQTTHNHMSHVSVY